MKQNTGYYHMDELEEKIKYSFQDKELLKLALTHSSYSNDRRLGKLNHNERVEFLGDAVLELICSEELYRRYPEKMEGELTKLRTGAVCEQTLASCARDIGLDQFLMLGRGEEALGGRSRDSVLSDAFEALIGAMYLDGGFANAKEFIKKSILEDLESRHLFYDSKTILQELVQKYHKERAEYVLTGEEGPDHDKTFRVEAVLEGRVIGHGEGRTKKRAEQQAAYEAILELKKNGEE